MSGAPAGDVTAAGPISARLAELGLQLPEVAVPLAAYVPATRMGQQILASGQLPTKDGAPILTGKVGDTVTTEQAAQAAETAVLNALAAVAAEAGGVESIKRIIKVTVFVASAPDFTGQPAVANGASELLGEIFGDAGKHVRSAVGVAVLPLDVPVELELVVEV